MAVAVVGIYAKRALRRARARRSAPAAVPITVQQQSAQFSFSKVEQDRTIFTIRASRATQYKDQNRALLEDVWITVYGRDGSRNDNIHTHECELPAAQRRRPLRGRSADKYSECESGRRKVRRAPERQPRSKDQQSFV